MIATLDTPPQPGLTSWLVSKLFAHYISILSTPAMITYSAPGVVDTDLNPPFIRSWAIHQSHITVSAVGVGGSWNYVGHNITNVIKLVTLMKCICTWAYNWGITGRTARTITSQWCTTVQQSTLISITLEATNQSQQFILNIPVGGSKCSYQNEK